MEKVMKSAILVLFPIAITAVAAPVHAQTTAPPDGTKTLAATMNVYVFPSQGQSPETQNKQEAECYAWAVQNTGVDPFDLSKQAQQSSQQAAAQQEAVSQQGKGTAAKGTVIGAAGGALIGEIASDDAGRGAAWGAALGALGGRRHRKQSQAAASQQVAQQDQAVQKATAQQTENFKKAFAVCLEAKDYMVKF